MKNIRFERGNRKIKVCHVITKMVYGGASIGTLHLVQKLSPRLFQSTIMCGRQSSNEGDLIADADICNFEVITIPEIVREINPVKDARAFIALVKEIRKNRFDIVHTHGSKAAVIGRLAAALCRVPVILYTVHGWGLKAGGLLTRVLFRFVERALAYFTTALLFQTKADRDEASQYKIGRHDQYVLIGNGINLEPFVKYDRRIARQIRRDLCVEGKRIIGTVGRVSAQKNPIGFVKIAQEVLDKNKNVVFLFAGGGEMLEKMKSMVCESNLEKNILFLGVRNDIPELMAIFDIFILPSLWEGMPRSVIEAMALSKPVIVYDIAGIQEIVEHEVSGIIVPMGDSEQFSHKIVFLLDHPAYGRELARQGRMTTKKYDFGQVIVRTESVYTRLIGRNVEYRGRDHKS